MDIKYYKHVSEQECLNMASDYDLAQRIESRAKGDFVTMHWAKPFEVEGVWYLQKPKRLECSITSRCYPNAVVVGYSEIPWPEGIQEP